MNAPRSLLVSIGGPDSGDSFAVRSDNLATLTTFDGLRTIDGKHQTCLSGPFVLSVYVDRAKRLSSSHVTGFLQRTECSLASDISCITSSPGYVAAGSLDGTIRLWRASDGELVVEQQLHLGPLCIVKIDPAIWVLYAASTTGRIGAWPIPELFAAGDPVHFWAVHSLKVTDIALSTNARVFSCSLDKTMRCFDLAAGCEILALNFPQSLTCCALAHNESVIYCGGIDGEIYQIHLAQDMGIQKTFEGHTAEVSDLVVANDDRSLYSASHDMSVRRWDTATGQTINHISTKGIPFALLFLPNLDQATATGPEEVKKGKQSRKNNQNKKKGFPKLQRMISGNVDEIISAPVDDIPILTADEELSIAVSDVCSQQSVKQVDQTLMKKDNIEKDNPEKKQPENNEIDALKRQNGLMFQYLLSQNNK